MPFVYSTTTNNTFYEEYAEAIEGSQIRQIKRKVLIKGGNGVANKHLVTPFGVATQVSDDDLSFLMNNEAFLRHMKRGFLKVEERNIAAEKVAADMTPKDKSHPLRPKDFDKDEAKPMKDESKKKWFGSKDEADHSEE